MFIKIFLVFNLKFIESKIKNIFILKLTIYKFLNLKTKKYFVIKDKTFNNKIFFIFNF